MDLARVVWRDGAQLLGRSAPFAVDAAYEFDAPTWCDFASLHAGHDTEQAEQWFLVPHPLHEPEEATPPPRSLLPPDASPYKSPAHPPHELTTWGKVSPGPSRTGLASATRLTASARKPARKQPASPIAIHSMLHSTPHKLAAAAAAAVQGTPHKLLPDSAGGAVRVAPRTPGSASKVPMLGAGAQRVLHKIQFDPIDEGPLSPSTGPAATAAATNRTRAKRISMAQMPPPPAASLFVSSSLYGSENAPLNQPAPGPAPTTKAARRTLPQLAATAAAPTTRKRRSNEVAAAAAPTANAPMTRKRRSNEVAAAAAAEAPALLALDPELELMLSAHNRQVAAEQAAEEELAHVLEQHNRALLAQQQGAPRSPATATHPSTAALAAPPSGNKAPKKKMRVAVPVASKVFGDSPPTLASGTATSRGPRKSMKPSSSSTALATVASTTAGMRATRSRKSVAPSAGASAYSSPSSQRQSRSSRTRSRSAYRSEEDVDMLDASSAALAATEQPEGESVEAAQVATGPDGDSAGEETDISFSVEDLGLGEDVMPAPLVAAPSLLRPLRKSMGKALRATVASADAADEAAMLLDDLIELDEPLALRPPATATATTGPPTKRMQATVSFTAAAAPAKTSRPTTAQAAKKTGGLSARNMNVPSNSISTKKAATSSKPSKTAPAGPAKKTAGGAMNALVQRAAAARPSIKAAQAEAIASFLLPEDDEISALLSAHNQTLRPKVRYTPRTHSAATVKAWEQTHGKKWYELAPDERLAANAQMDAMAMA